MLFKLSSGICFIAAVLSLSFMTPSGDALAVDGIARFSENQPVVSLTEKASINKYRQTSVASDRRTSSNTAAKITVTPLRANTVVRPTVSLSKITSGSISSGTKITSQASLPGAMNNRFTGTKIQNPSMSRISLASLVKPVNSMSSQSVLQANKPANPLNSAIGSRLANNRPAGSLAGNLSGIAQTVALNKPASPSLNKPLYTPNKITSATNQQNTAGILQIGNGNNGEVLQANLGSMNSTKPGNGNSSGKQTNGAVIGQVGNLNSGTISQVNGKLGNKPGNSTNQQNTAGILQIGNGNNGEVLQANLGSMNSTKPGNGNSSGKQTNGAVIGQVGNLNNGTISQVNGNVKPDDSPGKKPGPVVIDPVKKPENKTKPDGNNKKPSNTNKTNNADIDQIGDNNNAVIQQADQITNINQKISNNSTIVNAVSTSVVERPVVVAQPTIIAAAPQPSQVFIPVPSGNVSTDCRDRAVALNEKGLKSFENRDYVESERYFKLALEVLEGCGQKDNGLLATTLENLSIVYERLGRLDESARTRDLANRVRATA